MQRISKCFKFAAGVIVAAGMLVSCRQGGQAPAASADRDAKLAKLEARLGYLEDREQIRSVYMRYMRGFDRNDVALLKSAFWPDVQINYITQSNTLDQFIERHLNEHTRELAGWGHLLTNESIDINGDVAHVEVYVTQLLALKKGNPNRLGGATMMAGRYIDRLDRRNGEWRISVREFLGHSPADCARGIWDKRDPSYRRPLTRRPNDALSVGPVCAEPTEHASADTP